MLVHRRHRLLCGEAGKADHRVMVATTKAPAGVAPLGSLAGATTSPLASGETELQLLAHLVAILSYFRHAEM